MIEYNQIKEYIENRLEELNAEVKVPFNGNEYYDRIEAKIYAFEEILEKINILETYA